MRKEGNLMSYKIGVISDTHNLLRKEVKEHLAGCDMIFHAGDISKPSVIEELNQIAPTYVVRGNADKEWAEDIPETREITDIGVKVFMIHNKKQINVDLTPFNLVIFGHSHKYEEKMIEGRTWLNPGSCGPRRFHQPITMAMLYVEEDGSFHIQRIDIPHEERNADAGIPAEHMKEHIPAMMKDIDKGVSVEKLAKKYHISCDLSEQICRLYLTHPGVDAEGIMRKMGI
jgi:putative phosphoesterase